MVGAGVLQCCFSQRDWCLHIECGCSLDSCVQLVETAKPTQDDVAQRLTQPFPGGKTWRAINIALQYSCVATYL